MTFLKKLTICCATASILITTSAAIAESQTPTPNATAAQASQPMIIPDAPSLDAKAYVLLDPTTGKVIAQKNADVKREPASLTKLMSLYLVFSALNNGTINLDDKVRISKDAWHTGGSRMFIKAGEEVPVNQLIQGVIVDSGNDATTALAEFVAGSTSSFVNMMNTQAQRLGMKNTHFMNPTGLPHKDHYTTAMDLATLARAIINDFPEEYHYFSEKWFTYNGIKQPNRNRLLWRFEGADGLKTGHTDEAGFCLISSAKKDDTRFISVLLGAATDNERADDSIRLLTYGFRFYQTKKVYDANTPVSTQRVWGGEDDTVQLGLAKPLFVTVPTGEMHNIKTQITLQDDIKAPVKKNKAYGKIDVLLNGKTIATESLIALNSNKEGGIVHQLTDSVSLSIHHLLNHNSDEDKKS
ncbi:MAG: D-alanyl-D-alanine carboxypeptidase family protein [Gammaproteobacteria bacterium]